jgi:A/G-specific adenine glycosylase
MLEKRPPTGIWGGLWSFPETDAKLGFETIVLNQFAIIAEATQPLPVLSHAFTHFKLHIQPQPMQVLKLQPEIDEPKYIWLSIEDAIGAAIPTPIRKILHSLLKQSVINAHKKSA